MKTKYYLSFLALPAILAACTNDDFEMQSNNGYENPALQNRAKVELTLNASKGEAEEGPLTRIVGETTPTGSVRWMWENENDKIGAVLVNYKSETGSTNDIASVTDNYMLTNYPFAPNITEASNAADFSTPTAVVEGAYLFYNRYDGNQTTRKQLTAEIDRIQTVNAGEEAGLKQIGTDEEVGQNFFISPLVQVAVADGSDIQIPLNLTSAHAMLRFTFKADLENKYWGNFEINKVTLTAVGDNKFSRTLTVNPKAIAELQAGLKGTDPKGEYYDWFCGNGAIRTLNEDGSLVDAEQINDAIALVNAKISGQDAENSWTELPEIGTESDDVTELTYQLETPYVFKNKDQEMELMVIIPADTYTNIDGDKEYQGTKNGMFLLNVYTSEGVYHAYIANSNDNDKRTFKRGVVVNMPAQTLAINGGNTNVELFEQAEAFNVETTADWNYTIEYINNHYRDYGAGSEWTVPVLKLTKDAEITVDAEHYFPEFPVKYEGDATLKLVGQNEYTINPLNVILAAGNDRPTLNVTKQKNATVLFDKDINSSVKVDANTAITDGTNGTAAIKLVSDAKILVKEGVEVTFETLENSGEMTIEKDNGEKDPTVALIKESAINKGTIIVAGHLTAESTATFTNDKDATITVKGYPENAADTSVRGRADFQNITNNGTIDIEVGSDNKGTYGGWLNVKGTLTNTATINNNGELFVETIANTGIITLEEDPYAVIDINAGTITGTVKGKPAGKIVLADATKYEMFEGYYQKSQGLSAVKATGVIETTLNSQAEYDQVIANYKKYATTQEAALEVLTTIYVNSSLKLAADASMEEIDLYMGDNVTLDVTALNNKKINGIYAEGSNNVLAASNAAIINANYMDVAKAANLTINKEVSVILAKSNETMLNVAGTLLNKGYIDTEEGNKQHINTVISGTLTNEGRLSQSSGPKYGTEFNEMTQLILNLWNGTNFAGEFNGARIDLVDVKNGNEYYSKNENTWNTQIARGDVTGEWVLNRLFTEGSLEMVKWSDGQSYQAITVSYIAKEGVPAQADWKVAFYLGGNAGEEVLSATEWNTIQAAGADYFNAAMTVAKADGTIDQMPTINKTWFYVTKNTGILDLTYAEKHKESWAYGEIVDNKSGKLYGEFNSIAE